MPNSINWSWLTDLAEWNRSLFQRRLAVALWTAFNIALFATTVVWDWSSVNRVALKVVLSISIIVEIVMSSLAHQREPLPPGAEPGVVDDLQAILRYQNAHSRQYTDYSDLARLLLSQSDFRLRTLEYVDIQPEGIARRAITTWRLPVSTINLEQGAPVILPIIIALKGTLVHQLEVLSGDDTLLPVLPYDISQRTVVETWRQVVRAVESELRRDDHSNAASLAQAAFIDGVGVIIGVITKRERRSAVRINLVAEDRLADWKQRNPLASAIDEQRLGGTATTFLRLFAAHYMVSCAIDTPEQSGHFVTRHGYSLGFMDPFGLSYAPRTGLRKRLSWIDRSRPNRIIFGPELAYRSRSYHLYMRTPKGNHFAEATLRTPEGLAYERPRLGSYVGSKPYFNRSRLGTTFVHLYTRGFKRAPEGLVVDLRINEPPWGLLGLAVLLSLASASALLVMAHWSGEGAPGVLGSVVGLPVAFATAVLAFTGPRRQRKVTYSTVGLTLFFLTFLVMAAGITADIVANFKRGADGSSTPNLSAVAFIARISIVLALWGLGVFLSRSATWILERRREERETSVANWNFADWSA